MASKIIERKRLFLQHGPAGLEVSLETVRNELILALDDVILTPKAGGFLEEEESESMDLLRRAGVASIRGTTEDHAVRMAKALANAMGIEVVDNR